MTESSSEVAVRTGHFADNEPGGIAAISHDVVVEGVSDRAMAIVSRILVSLFEASARPNCRVGRIDAAIKDLRPYKSAIADLGYEIIRLENDLGVNDRIDHVIDIALSQSGALLSDGDDTFDSIIAAYPARLRGIAETLDVLKKREPAVPIADSVQPDFLICLEDGKRLKLLKRHLKRCYGMTPDQYRARWGLPNDYPMVASNYSQVRSRLAHENGLGHKNTDDSDE